MKSLELVPPSADHAAIFLRWRKQPSAVRHNPIIRRNLRELRELLDTLGSDLSREHHAYMWFVRWGDELVGSVSLKEINRQMSFGEVGYTIGEAHQGKGLGTRAVSLLVDKVFRETDLHKLMAYVSQKNVPSRRLAERVGFRKEGLLREHYVIRGKRVNEVIYGLLRSEWAPGNR
jgi:ribosomal-protein-alanine N-acetyltransferase